MHCVIDEHMKWDYCLWNDCLLLCRHRCDGRLPFQPIEGLWDRLDQRRRALRVAMAQAGPRVAMAVEAGNPVVVDEAFGTFVQGGRTCARGPRLWETEDYEMLHVS